MILDKIKEYIMKTYPNLNKDEKQLFLEGYLEGYSTGYKEGVDDMHIAADKVIKERDEQDS